MINRIGTILFIFLAIFAGFFIYKKELAPCVKPVFYSIGTIDSRFGITKEKFLSTTKEAEAIWEDDANQNLFDYKDDARFKINLIFDDRQEQTLEANYSKEEIESYRAQYDSMAADYKSLANSYERDLALYNSNVAIFEKRLADYNDWVSEINSRGGATPKERQKLEEERKELESEKNILDSQRLALNDRASRLNFLGDSVNSLGRKLNITVDIHNQRFGDGREFEQGQTIGKKEINIYQFDTIGDLRLVLAHELGHAIGLEHVENPKSLMYYLMDQQNPQNPVLSSEDLSALNDRCNF
ncbi:MAG: matrixin family metalloprotease [bacterium]|nr:matrixin family metalloprotease [bacterium]